MATMDKKSIRNEIDKIKTDFKQFSKKHKIHPELKVIINSMLLLINILVTIFLEKQTKKNNRNASIPSSQMDAEDDTSTGKPGKNSKGKNTKNQTASNTRTVETTTTLTVDTCDQCGENLQGIDCKACERRTRIDIFFEKSVEHYDAEIKHCPACNTDVKASFPKDLKGPLQYGNGIKAFVITQLVSQMLSLKRLQTLLVSLIGKTLSEATFLSYIMQLYLALALWEDAAKEYVLRQKSIYTDETSLRVAKKKQWIHVYSSNDVTLKFLHKKRGTEAMKDINLIPRYGGTIVHDCWASYLSYSHCSHGLCGAHILRELTFVIESNHYRWAKNMKRLLQTTCKIVSQKKRKRLTKKAYAKLQRNYRNILTRGKKEMPAVLKKTDGRRAKIAKSDAHNLLERLCNYEDAVLLFAKNSDVAFTNNRAERDLRMAKVKQKVSGCFRVEKYAHAYCRISSYLQTMENKGINPLIAIQMALNGEIKGV